MKSKFGWVVWGGRTFIVSICASFLAFFISRLLVWFIKGQGSLDIIGVFYFSINASWRLGVILAIVAVILVLIGSFKDSRK